MIVDKSVVKYPSRWPVKNTELIQLYTVPTPNGQKISIMLEEVGLPYEAHSVNILEGEQFDKEFFLISPNSKIPVLVDPDGPSNKPVALMESGAILLYLAKKTGRLLPKTDEQYWEMLQWLFFQVASVGPMFGQFGHFYKYAVGTTADSYGIHRYRDEANRLLGVLEQRLSDNRLWIMGKELTIADMAIAPWLKGIDWYGGQQEVNVNQFKSVSAYRDRFFELPSAKRGGNVGALNREHGNV
ncbi:MAG: glutathione S-transferase N-terminal domain-containing protein [Cellvibrionaceae bacterium]